MELHYQLKYCRPKNQEATKQMLNLWLQNGAKTQQHQSHQSLTGKTEQAPGHFTFQTSRNCVYGRN